MINIREVVNISNSWAEDVDTSGELHKVLIPVLTNALNYDIQEAANKATAAIQSGVSIYTHTHRKQMKVCLRFYIY